MKFLDKLGILSQLRGVGVSQSQVFLNQNHMVILLGFCHNKAPLTTTDIDESLFLSCKQSDVFVIRNSTTEYRFDELVHHF